MRNTILPISAFSALLLAGSAPAHAQSFDEVKKDAVEMFGNAKQYASQTWSKMFPEKVEICIGYGTEKEAWLKKEVEKFSKNPANSNLTVKLVPIGSVVGADAIQKNAGKVGSGANACTMTAWSPASAVYRDYVVQRTYRAMTAANAAGQITKADDLIAAQANSLVRIPLVFVMWQDVYKKITDAAKKADPTVTDEKVFTFEGLIRANQSDAVDGTYTTFFMTNPGESNSGFSSLFLMAYEFTNAGRGGLDANAVAPRNAAFWNKAKQFYTATDGKSLKNFNIDSTGTLFREKFLVNGPLSEFSGVVTYENLAIQYADFAKKTHNTTYKVVYPARNVMSDNPYYVLNAVYDGTTNKVVMTPEKEKKAAIAFMLFLLEPEQQRDAVALGFRPGNIAAAIDIGAATSPFVTLKDYGIQANPANVRFVSTSNAGEQVISNLLSGWADLAAGIK